MLKVGAISGGFDPLHRGHLEHIIKAKKLCDVLVVFVSNDADMIRKKGYCLLPMRDRVSILRSIKWVDLVIPTLDKDGTQAETLRFICPSKYMKGGDRNSSNMPQNEIDVCEELGIEIIYGVGDLLNSSSDMMKRAMEQYNAHGRRKASIA